MQRNFRNTAKDTCLADTASLKGAVCGGGDDPERIIAPILIRNPTLIVNLMKIGDDLAAKPDTTAHALVAYRCVALFATDDDVRSQAESKFYDTAQRVDVDTRLKAYERVATFPRFSENFFQTASQAFLQDAKALPEPRQIHWFEGFLKHAGVYGHCQSFAAEVRGVLEQLTGGPVRAPTAPAPTGTTLAPTVV